MEEEHTGEYQGFGISNKPFTSFYENDPIETTPHFEWDFVVNPHRIHEANYPLADIKKTAVDKPVKKRETKDPGELLQSAAKAITDRLNSLQDGAGVTYDEAAIQAELDDAQLLKVEVIALRLYTGYNNVLRAIGNEDKKGFVPRFCAIYPGLSVRNKFTTTIHVINSGIQKLSRLQPVRTVYRGLRGMKPPSRFLIPDKMKVQGGIEWGFMSTTIDENVAMLYAGCNIDDTASTLIDAEMGMVDRGADISWLSQYPDEAEILFPPLTAIDVLEEGIQQRAGREMYCMKVRLTLCQHTKTLKELLAERKTQMKELLKAIQSDVKNQFRGLDTKTNEILLDDLKHEMNSQSMDLNDNSVWQNKMEKALTMLSKVGDPVQTFSRGNSRLFHTDAVCGIVAIETHREASVTKFATSGWDGRVAFWTLDAESAEIKLEITQTLPAGSMALATIMDRYSVSRMFENRDYASKDYAATGGGLDRLLSGHFDGSVATIWTDVISHGDSLSFHERRSSVRSELPLKIEQESITAVAVLHVKATRPGPALDLENPSELDTNEFNARVATSTKSGQIYLMDPNATQSYRTAGRSSLSRTLSESRDKDDLDGTGDGMIIHPHGACGKVVQEVKCSANSCEGEDSSVRAMAWVQYEDPSDTVLYVAFGEEIIAWSWQQSDQNGDPELRERPDLNIGRERTNGTVTALIAARCDQGARPCLVSAANKTVSVWKQGCTLTSHCSHSISKGSVTSLAWLPNPKSLSRPNNDSGWIAIGGDGRITLWNHDKANGVPLSSFERQSSVHKAENIPGEFPEHNLSSVMSLCWLPQSGWLVSGHRDGSVCVWRIRTGSDTTNKSVTILTNHNWQRAARAVKLARENDMLARGVSLKKTATRDKATAVDTTRVRLVETCEPAMTEAAVGDKSGKPEPVRRLKERANSAGAASLSRP